MKRLLTLCLVAFCTLSLSLAQDQEPKKLTKHQQRKLEREAKEAHYDSLITNALRQQNFSFNAEYLTQEGTNKIQIRSARNIIFVTPKVLRVILPYYSSTQSYQTTPLSIDFEVSEYSYDYHIDKKGVHCIEIIADNVRNNQSNAKTQSGRYIINFDISSKSGNAFVRITPTFTSNITYSGIITVNESF